MHARVLTSLGPAGTTVYLHGELDLADKPALRRRLTEAIAAGSGRVALDAAGVTFIDYSCLRELALAMEVMERCGRSFVVQRPSRIFSTVAVLAGRSALLDGVGAAAPAARVTGGPDR